MAARESYLQVTEEGRQIGDVQRAFDVMRGHKQQTLSAIMEIEEIATGGSFDTIPTDLKQALLRWKGFIDDLISSINADTEVKELSEIY